MDREHHSQSKFITESTYDAIFNTFSRNTAKYGLHILNCTLFIFNSLNNTTLEGFSSCPNVIILRLGTYQLRIARHQLAVIGVGNRAIRSSHVKFLGGRH